MNRTNEILHDLLKRQRERANLSIEMAAQHLSVSLEELRRWEADPTKVPLSKIAALLALYKTGANDFREALLCLVHPTAERPSPP